MTQDGNGRSHLRCVIEGDNSIHLAIAQALEDVGNMLIEKNAAYGNSALDPVRIFSKANPSEQIRVRIDDKLSRLMRGAAAGEDTMMDLMGYLILLRVWETT